MLLVELQLSFTVFLLKIFCSMDFSGKCLYHIFKKILPIWDFTSKLKWWWERINQMRFLFFYFPFCLRAVIVITGLNNPLPAKHPHILSSIIVKFEEYLESLHKITFREMINYCFGVVGFIIYVDQFTVGFHVWGDVFIHQIQINDKVLNKVWFIYQYQNPYLWRI